MFVTPNNRAFMAGEGHVTRYVNTAGTEEWWYSRYAWRDAELRLRRHVRSRQDHVCRGRGPPDPNGRGHRSQPGVALVAPGRRYGVSPPADERDAAGGWQNPGHARQFGRGVRRRSGGNSQDDAEMWDPVAETWTTMASGIGGANLSLDGDPASGWAGALLWKRRRPGRDRPEVGPDIHSPVPLCGGRKPGPWADDHFRTRAPELRQPFSVRPPMPARSQRAASCGSPP